MAEQALAAQLPLADDNIRKERGTEDQKHHSRAKVGLGDVAQPLYL
jgi:hypothetical protein